MGLLFWVLFGQTLKKTEMCGILFSVGAILCISLSKLDEQVDGDASPGLAILFIILSVLIYVGRNALIKWELRRSRQENLGDAFQNLFSFIYAVVFLLVSIWYFKTHDFHTTEYWVFGLIGGLLGHLSEVGAVFANSWGVAGPASAIIETCSLIQTVIQAIINQQMPNWLEILGLLLGLGAGFFIIFGERAVGVLCGRKRHEE